MSASLLDAPAVVVQQVAKFSSPREEYDLFGPDGTPLGRIEEQASVASFFARKLATLRYRVTDAAGELVGTIEKPGAIGRSSFLIYDASSQQVGVIEQENLFMDPQFSLHTPSGDYRLTSTAINAWTWTLADEAGGQVGGISREFAGLADVFTSAEHFVVQLGPQLIGPTRLVALVACACLDFVRDQRAAKRRNNSGLFE